RSKKRNRRNSSVPAVSECVRVTQRKFLAYSCSSVVLGVPLGSAVPSAPWRRAFLRSPEGLAAVSAGDSSAFSRTPSPWRRGDSAGLIPALGLPVVISSDGD